MKHHSPERREAILQKMAPPHNMTVPELAQQEGIAPATLYNWRKLAREKGHILPSRSARPDQWTSQEKFRVVLETASMSEAELSAYCREKSLYPEQVEQWREACLSANADAAERERHAHQANKKERQRVKQLEKELQRKEKALAETAALLVLSKKAEAIWGTQDEDE